MFINFAQEHDAVYTVQNYIYGWNQNLIYTTYTI